MPAPLVVRLLADAAGYIRTFDTAIATNTKFEESVASVGNAVQISADKRVAASLKATRALEAEVAGYRALAESATASAETQARATLLADKAQQRLNATMGISAVATASAGSAAAKTGERDLGKLTRGVLAGSGAASSLGRSLAFASTGFIAVAGGATLLASSIKASISLAKTQRQVEAQLKTGGRSWAEYGDRITSADLKLSHLSGFTNQELLQGFGYLVRGNNNVSESLKLTAVAADVARGRNISLASASIALAKAQGGSLTALRRLGIIVPKHLSTMQALAFVTQKFAGQAEAGATSTDHFHAALVNTEETIGTAVLPTFTRLITELGNWLDKMNQTGRLQRDVHEGLTLLGTAFHTVEGAINIVDKATGGLNNTLRILFTVWLGRETIKAIGGIERLAASWGLLATSANAAAAAEERAAIAGAGAGAAGAAGGAGAAVGGLGAGALLGATARRLLGRGTLGRTFAVDSAGVATETTGAAGLGLAAGSLSATGIGALVVGATIAAGALDTLAKSALHAAHAPSIASSAVDAITGVLTGGLVGDKRFGILPELLSGSSPFRRFLFPPAQPTPRQRNLPPYLRLGGSGVPDFIRPAGLLGLPPGASAGPFGAATPIAVYAKYSQTISEAIAAAQAALTKTTADDVQAAKSIIARIKRLIDEGHLQGNSLLQALQDEASQQSILNSARQAAAQQAATIAAAKKAAASSYTIPIDLQLAEARAQLTTATADDVRIERQILAAAKAAIASGKKNKQGQLAALQIELQAKQAIESATQQTNAAFTVSAKLGLDIARDQALGKGITDDLLEEKKALFRWISTHRKNIQGVTDAYNQISAINSQLNSAIVSAYGDFKVKSVKVLTQNLGLTPDQRRRLEQRLSQRGPGGTTPEQGTGAAGYIIDPLTGRPVRVGHHDRRRRLQAVGGATGGSAPEIKNVIDLTVLIDGKQVEASVTENQQRRRRHNPTQTRGPNAATSVA